MRSGLVSRGCWMTEPPLATIAIPTFNRAHVLARAVRSATDQDYPNVEILVIDNASDDSTPSVCRALGEADSRIKYVRQEVNVGPIRNFETGLELARGTYFMWLADDDWIAPDYIRMCIDELERGGHIVVVGSDYWHFDNGDMLPQPIVSALDPEPQRRMLGYLATVSSNAAVYGLTRTTDSRACLPFSRQIGGDWLWMLRLLDRGTLFVVADVALRRSAGGVSRDLRRLAGQLGHGPLARALPRVAMTLGMTRALITDDHLVSLRARRSRVAIGVRAGLICWVRVGATGEFTSPVRLRLQAWIPQSLYRVLRTGYRPIRVVQDALRTQVLGR